GQERIPGLSPFGEDFKTIPVPRERAGLVQTPLGFFDLKNPRWAERLPRGLTRAATRSRAGRGGLAPGANILQVSEQALRDLGADAVERELGKAGRVVAAVPDRSFVVRARNAGDLDRLAALPFVEASTPYHAAFKIDRTLGRAPLIQASRARSTTLELMVAAWPGADHAELQALRRDVEAIAGARAVSEYDGDGTVLRVEAPAGQVTPIAALDSVAAVEEIPEIMAANAEGPSLTMTGSVEDTLGARPYHDIGVDGGGIDTNGDGQRINDGSDLVPPQIVAVTDNGLSYDSAQFSQSATMVTDLFHPIRPLHR